MADARQDSSSWEMFCREEARRWAASFLDKVRAFKLRNPANREIHDSAFTNEFSAAFLEESSLLQSQSSNMHTNGGQNFTTTNLTSSQDTNSPVVTRRNNSKTKSWLSSLFKWSKGSRSRHRSRHGSPSRRFRRHTESVKEDLVRMLNMNADDTTSTWQSCRLTLLKENANHQLEVYSPPKSAVPKMSLFCFLISEVRAATSLEIPDSTTCFVIKSQNHGEYVFDAGSESKKQTWIATIKTYSNNLVTRTNGHLPGYSGSRGSNRPRSYSIGAGDMRQSPLVTSLPTPIHPLEASLTDDSVLADVSSFVRNSATRSPSRRRQVQSMFIETNSGMESLSNTRSGFPYDSPCPSPPPVPKRGNRPKNYAIGTATRLDPVPKPSSPVTPLPNGTPQRRASQPHIGLQVPLELPSNLDTCSVSSSSSALHPVTLADIERRGPMSPSHVKYSSQLSILSEGQAAAKPATTRTRKISAPLLIPHQPYLDQDIVYPEKSKNKSTDNFLPVISGSASNEQSYRKTPEAQNPHDLSREFSHDEAMTSRATLSFPYNGRNSPVSQLARPLSEEEQLVETRRRLVPYNRLNVSSLAGILPQTPPQTEPATERAHSQASNNTDGSEDSHPLYIETNEDIPQTATHTQHPYENWATNAQDVQNLKNLSQYQWFHGMISRNNATQLVLADGDAGSGQYLVRQSESREGDFVLTFNYHNKAKHLRMTVDGSGCNIQHLWFEDVPSMLEYFKTNSIPLESFWLNNDVKLTTFINRRKSDSFRTTTVVNMTKLQRVPPRRSRSLHLTMSQAVNGSLDNSSPGLSDNSSNSESTNSLPQTTRNSIGWRQLFRSQRSSSAGNMSVHGVRSGASVQRRHSTNAGSVLDARNQSGNSPTASASGRGSGSNSRNAYVYRNY